VRHGHFTVNGRKVDIPSFSVKPGDVVAIRQSSRTNASVAHALEEVKGRGVPAWLQFDAEGMSGKVSSIPTREQINLPVQEQLIVELYGATKDSLEAPARDCAPGERGDQTCCEGFPAAEAPRVRAWGQPAVSRSTVRARFRHDHGNTLRRVLLSSIEGAA
jgi:hypothetical protein